MTWKAVPGWAGFYEVSDAGLVRSVDRTVFTARHGSTRYRGRVLTPSLSSGYALVTLVHTSVGRREPRYVHDLVLETFIGPKPAGQEVCHGPEGPTVNTLANLRYDTRSANANDRKKFGVGWGPSPLKKPPVVRPCAVCGVRLTVRRDRQNRRHVCKDPMCRSEFGRQARAGGR